MARRSTRYKAPYVSLIMQNPAWRNRMDTVASQIADTVWRRMKGTSGEPNPWGGGSPGPVVGQPARGLASWLGRLGPGANILPVGKGVPVDLSGQTPPDQVRNWEAQAATGELNPQGGGSPGPVVAPSSSGAEPIDDNTFFANIVGELRNRYGQDLDNDTIRLLLYQLQRLGLSKESSLPEIDKMMQEVGRFIPPKTPSGEPIDLERLRETMRKSGGFGLNVGFSPFSWGGVSGLGQGLVGARGFATGTSQPVRPVGPTDTRQELMKKLRIIKYLRAHGVDLFPGYAGGTSNAVIDRLNRLLSQRRPLR